MDVDIAMVGCAPEFWQAHGLSIDFPLCSRDDQEWFSAEFRVWRDTQDPIFVFNLSSSISTDMPLPTNILRDYTLEFEIRVKRAFTDLKECLREVVRDRDCYREIANTLIEDIKETSSVQESDLAAFRAELNRKGLTPPGTEAECA